MGDGHFGMIPAREKALVCMLREKNMEDGTIGIKVDKRRKKVYTQMV